LRNIINIIDIKLHVSFLVPSNGFLTIQRIMYLSDEWLLYLLPTVLSIIKLVSCCSYMRDLVWEAW